MNIYILSVIIIGASGIAGQVVLLRELLVSFYGNELSLGLILANWIASEALGVFIIGKAVDKVRNKINIFLILQVIFSLALPLSVYLSRTIKPILGVPFAEAMALPQIFYSSLFIMLPVGFCHGALFSSACRIHSSYTKDSAGSVGKIYAWETIGTIIGGIILTYIFIPRLDSFHTVFIVSVLNILICLFFLRSASGIFRYLIVFLILLAAYLPLAGALDKIQDYAIQKQWQAQEVLDYRNSVYGNIVVIRKEEQLTFFYNGLPIINTPYPDIIFAQEFGNIPLLFHPAPKDVLIIGGGAGGLINEIIKHPVKGIDYAELDPMIIDMVKKHPSALTQKELGDNRVKVVNNDGRFFIKNTPGKYDVIMVGLSKPSDLHTNRLFTREFFILARKKLNPGGIIAFYLPGSSAYLSSQLRDLNACILNALKSAYGYLRIIPGDYNLFLASDSEGIMGVSPQLITQRMRRNNIEPGILVPDYLNYRLDKSHLEWFTRSSTGATPKSNRDFAPFAVYEMLIIWNKQFSSGLAGALEALGKINLGVILVLIFALTLAFFFIFSSKHKLSIAYSIATTGFFGMLMNLILIFSFQIIYGYLYHMIGLLISLFMTGAAAGSIFMSHRVKKIKDNLSLFIGLEAMIIVFSYLAAAAIAGLASGAGFLTPLFITLFFISGLFIGLEFPLAARIYLDEKEEVGFTSGLLYFSDLMGGWLAGILCGALFLPILGLFNTCLVIILMKLSSLILLVIFRKRLTNPAI